jgi:membrane fusion protein, copper/silver efflux system
MSDHATRPPDAGMAVGPLPEGEEAPPPGVRTMGTVRWALVALMVAVAAGTWVSWADLGSRSSSAAVRYRCPMHPAVVQERKGECPICGMDLVLVEASAVPGPQGAVEHAKAGAPTKVRGKYWCPMHPEIASDDPGATCPKCGGMKLVPRDPGAMARAAAAAGAGAYWCPMHPEITSDDPSATCPKCGGMRLMLRPGPSGRPGGPVPGLTPVEIGAERTQLMGMRTAQVSRRRLAPQLRTVGFVAANESSLAIITTRFTGWVEDLRVAQSGQRVERGQVLATVYSPELLTAQQVYLNALKWIGDRNAQPGTQPGGGLEGEARRRLGLLGIAKEDVAELSRRGKPLEAMPIRSPMAGYVAKKGALPGLYVQPGSELFQIADLSTVWVVADVYESDMSRIQVGQRGRLLLGAYPGEAFTGSVQFIYPAVNPESRTLQARMEFKNPGLRLRPGMYGDVIIELASTEGLAVPTDAVVDTGELQYVFLVRGGGRFEPRVVRLGARGDGLVQLLEGVAEGDVVVTTANFLVDSESRLRAAVEGFTPVPAHEEAKEHEREDRRESDRAARR